MPTYLSSFFFHVSCCVLPLASGCYYRWWVHGGQRRIGGRTKVHRSWWETRGSMGRERGSFSGCTLLHLWRDRFWWLLALPGPPVSSDFIPSQRKGGWRRWKRFIPIGIIRVPFTSMVGGQSSSSPSMASNGWRSWRSFIERWPHIAGSPAWVFWALPSADWAQRVQRKSGEEGRE